MCNNAYCVHELKKQECQTVTRYARSKVLDTMLNAWNALSDLKT